MRLVENGEVIGVKQLLSMFVTPAKDRDLLGGARPRVGPPRRWLWLIIDFNLVNEVGIPYVERRKCALAAWRTDLPARKDWVAADDALISCCHIH